MRVLQKIGLLSVTALLILPAIGSSASERTAATLNCGSKGYQLLTLQPSKNKKERLTQIYRTQHREGKRWRTIATSKRQIKNVSRLVLSKTSVKLNNPDGLYREHVTFINTRGDRRRTSVTVTKSYSRKGFRGKGRCNY